MRQPTGSPARSKVIWYSDDAVLLKRRTGGKNPSSLFFFDTEADCGTKGIPNEIQHQRLRLGVAIGVRLDKGNPTRREVFRFKTQEDFWFAIDRRLKQQNSLWIFAHNLSYDATLVGLWYKIKNGDLLLFNPKSKRKRKETEESNKSKYTGLICDDNPPNFVICWDKHGRRLTFVDTFNYFKTSIAELGKALGIEKIDVESFDIPDAELFYYCYRDVEIIEKTIIHLIQWMIDKQLGSFKLSAPSLAMEAFRTKFYKINITTHWRDEIRQLERAAYYGGRLELFRIGEVNEKVYAFDVQSMYPYIMREQQFPVRLVDDYTKSTRCPNIEDLSEQHIAEVRIKSDDETYPKVIKNVGLCFCNGEFWTTLAGPELIRAKQNGHIWEVGNWSKYKLDRPFVEYIDFFWKLRKEYKESGNKIYDTFVKLFMNMFYGKFGAKVNEWKTVDYDPNYDAEFRAVIGRQSESVFDEIRVILGYIQKRITDREHEESFPAITAYVTAYAREYLLQGMKAAGVDNVYYVVTDAIYCNEAGKIGLEREGLIEKGTLGRFVQEAEGDCAIFQALHHFECGGRIKYGSRKKQHKIKDDGGIEQTQFEGLRSILKRGPTDYVVVQPVTKYYAKEYKKGHVRHDGTVIPFQMFVNPLTGESQLVGESMLH